jgi:hypothetical protein
MTPPNNEQPYPSYAFPGGYTIRYIVEEGEIVCAKCVNARRLTEDDEEFVPPVGSTLYWEGPTVQCAECNEDMESEYGDPDDDDDN